MKAIPVTPELQESLDRLEKFANEHGQTTSGALQDAASMYLEAQSEV